MRGAGANCAFWTRCGKDAYGYPVIVDAWTEEAGDVEAELLLCEEHAVALGIIRPDETTEGGEQA